MKLSDIMANMGLATYAEVGLVIFLLVFAAIVLNLLRSSKSEMDYAAHIPLADEATPADHQTPGEGSDKSRRS